MKPLTISIVQFDITWKDIKANLLKLDQKIKALPTHTQVIVLPEMFATGFCFDEDIAEDENGMIFKWLKDTSKTYGKIIVGSLLFKEEEQYFNRLIWMLPNGQFHDYDKRHLFSFSNEDKWVTAGDKRLIVSVNGWKICLQICYDLRFPVWCRQQKDKYDILINIANWPQARSYPWKVLLQARAIENQAIVIGANRVGYDENQVYYSGDSALIDPLGKVIWEKSDTEECFTYTLQENMISSLRNRFPFLKDGDEFIIL